MKKFAGIIIALLLFPWLVSLAWSGAAGGTEKTALGEEQAVDETADAGGEVEANAGAGGAEEIADSAGAGVNSAETGADGADGSNAVGGDAKTAGSGKAAGSGVKAAARGADGPDGDKGERRILVERNGIQTYIGLEDYLPGVIVCQISQECGMEALKCQAVIARTYICRLMDGRNSIWEEELDLDYLSENQKHIPWDREKTAQYLEQCRQAAADTAGVIMQYEGREILPLFHGISAGRTRTGDENYPYLQSVESRWDTERDDYLQTMEWGLPAFAGLINGIPGAAAVAPEQLPAEIQTVKKDDAGYIMQMKVGAKTYTGEEIQYALGLPSSCFTLEGNSEGIRAVVKGSGHGYGLSQAGADAMAKEGWGYQDILNYYYKNISLISE